MWVYAVGAGLVVWLVVGSVTALVLGKAIAVAGREQAAHRLTLVR